jgi:hypothetical protein
MQIYKRHSQPQEGGNINKYNERIHPQSTPPGDEEFGGMIS